MLCSGKTAEHTFIVAGGLGVKVAARPLAQGEGPRPSYRQLAFESHSDFFHFPRFTCIVVVEWTNARCVLVGPRFVANTADVDGSDGSGQFKSVKRI
jgi:hypothetical protein